MHRQTDKKNSKNFRASQTVVLHPRAGAVGLSMFFIRCDLIHIQLSARHCGCQIYVIATSNAQNSYHWYRFL